ncbi:MAG: hypothetical protein HKP30_09150 [Myxococcales bacterium]|nr:hypothetical protein [Myxococcales bacterium]
MAQSRGSKDPGRKEPAAGSSPKGHGDAPPKRPQGPPDPAGPDVTGLPEVARRLIALGLSGVFSTQETIRQAVGDALPKEWMDFAVDQSERTRAEFLERFAGELARTLESIDLARVMQQALEGRTLEVTAKIRMLPDDGKSGTRLALSMVDDDPE